MKCADCGNALERARVGGVGLEKCPGCGGLWVLDNDFKGLRAATDRFVRWLNPDLWSDIEKHEIGRGGRDCPGCGGVLHEVRYADSEISIDICPACRGVWLQDGELKKIVSYLEEIVDARTVGDYLKSIGHETAEIVTHQEKISEDIKDLGVLMKLLEYRVISRFPTLSRLASKLPPV